MTVLPFATQIKNAGAAIEANSPIKGEVIFCVQGVTTPPCGLRLPFGVQTSLLEDAGFQPFVDHPSDNAVRDSSVEEVPEMAVVDRVEIFLDINIDDTIVLLDP